MPPIDHHRKGRARLSLEDILNGPDEFGLLAVKAKEAGGGLPVEVTKFEEINTFIEQHGRVPASSGALSEKLLARRLNTYLHCPESHASLKPYDRYGLLSSAETETQPSADPVQPRVQSLSETENVTSLEDIFASEAFAALDQGEAALFEPVHVAFATPREIPEEIAQRRICKDFSVFEPLFKALHQGLQSGKIKTARFQRASQMRTGDAFILEGVLCLIDEVGERREDNQGRYDPRLRVIFENGTESNHLLQSLAKRLYQDENGRRIMRDPDSVEDAFNNITHKDQRAGQIYLVATKSEHPDLQGIPNLIKIGYTEQTVEERTKNAARETAFLEAPVKILASMECYNLNPRKFETLIHGFLHAQRLQITLIGQDGKKYHPQEWFSVPLETAREVVKRILDGSIVHYRMDNTRGQLVKKSAT
ncbi:Meiotically up-regulated gene 113 [Allopseudospirillum japonicum]|uniref:Meiotically up-regulated gene 113 n=1 Tax=Allopseudospirillum japonicum TaxID=64971 RepID=A0A1H6SBB2_9GAMM|nr:GIY-YIG nuclease family protein [Allopseudospirillum japonicum]SEI63204.1 Meiotically up-regulated gene 113 [Allopseudospirillum japonicum]